MKVHEIIPTVLEENAFKRLATAAVLATATSAPLKTDQLNSTRFTAPTRYSIKTPLAKTTVAKATQRYINNIKSKYRALNNNPKLVQEIVKTAEKYADPVFPTTSDILAVIGIESSFNPHAVSKLKFDPARGLMQVRPGIWSVDPNDLHTIEGAIKHGSDILKKYYSKFKSKEAALHAYNVGETNYRKGVRNQNYVDKHAKEKAHIISKQPQTVLPNK